MFDEIDSNIEVINSQDQYPLDCCIWLQFKINTNSSFNELLSDFEQKELDYSKWSHNVPPEMNWWNPENFKINGLYFERISDKKFEAIYTNKDQREFFYVCYLR